MDDDDPHELDYAGSDLTTTVETRIVVENGPEFTRFTDPPSSIRDLWLFVAFAVLCVLVSILMLAALTAHRTLRSHDALDALVALIFAAGGFQLGRVAWCFTTRSTVIEVSAKSLRISHPVDGELAFAPNDVQRIHRGSAISVSPDAYCWLGIRTPNKGICLLYGRPAAEVEWLASRLRQTLKRVRRLS